MRVLIIGASGRIGRLVSEKFENKGIQTYNTYRTPKPEYQKDSKTWIQLDLEEATNEYLRSLINDNNIDTLVFCLSLKYAKKVSQAIATLDIKSIFLGSARKYSKVKDPSVEKVKKAVQAASEQCKDWFFIHPTMIYGESGEDNLNRIAQVVNKLPIIPLPNGGKSLLQPIHAKDVAEALVNSTELTRPNQEVLLAGPTPLYYHDLFREIGKHLNKRVFIISIPLNLMLLAITISNLLPFLPNITKNELIRFLEDKNHDSGSTYQLLKLQPITLKQGLQDLFKKDSK